MLRPSFPCAHRVRLEISPARALPSRGEKTVADGSRTAQDGQRRERIGLLLSLWARLTEAYTAIRVETIFRLPNAFAALRRRLQFQSCGNCRQLSHLSLLRKIDVAGPIEFGGEQHFAASQEKLYALLTDLDAMAVTIPDLVSSEKIDDHTMRCVVRPGFSFLRGTMKLTIALSDLEKPTGATMSVAAQGIGVSMSVVSKLRIASEGTGSRLHWSATIAELKGLISAVSPALISAAANQVIAHSWTQVRERLGE
jgi:carbon monoxide dehydrogenase subunit G